jgi:hypothetical protein
MRSLLLLLASVLSTSVLGADSYLCIPDRVTGFVFNKESGWQTSNFTTDQKYLLTRPNEDERKILTHLNKKAAWVVREIGGHYPRAVCASEMNAQGFIFCDGLPDFKFNLKQNKYLSAYLTGYYNDDEEPDSPFAEGKNTPYIEIGKCSPL